MLVAVNFSADGGSVRLPRPTGGGVWRPVVGTHLDVPELGAGKRTLTLRGYEGLVLVAEG